MAEEYDSERLTDRALRAARDWEGAPGPQKALRVATAFANAYRFGGEWEEVGREERRLASDRGAWLELLADAAREGALVSLAPPEAWAAEPEALAAFTGAAHPRRRARPSSLARRAAEALARYWDEAEAAFHWLGRQVLAESAGSADGMFRSLEHFAEVLARFDDEARRNPHWFLPAAPWLRDRAAALVAPPAVGCFWWLSAPFLSSLEAAEQGAPLRLADALRDALGLKPEDLVRDAEGYSPLPPGTPSLELAAVTEDGSLRLLARPSHPTIANSSWRLSLWREDGGAPGSLEEGWRVECGACRAPVEDGTAELFGPLELGEPLIFFPPRLQRALPAAWVRLPAAGRPWGTSEPQGKERA